MKSLGKTLKDYRDLRSLTQRQVEEATGISNAYLSQLENDKIKKPSANILYKLSKLYQVDLDNLLKASGAIETDKNTVLQNQLFTSHAFTAENLTGDEEQALLDYLRYIRFNKR